MTTTLGDALAHLSKNERCARMALQLLEHSVVGAPDMRHNLGVWLAKAFERRGALSGGEKVIFDLALDCWNSNGRTLVADLAQLDADNRAHVAMVLVEWLAAGD